MKRSLLLPIVFVSVFSVQVQAGDDSGNVGIFPPLDWTQHGLKMAKEFMTNNLHMSAGLLIACLASRPAILWFKDKIAEKDDSAYAVDSIAGIHIGKKEEEGQYEAKAHVGSADVKVMVPAPEAFPFGKKKRSFMSLLASFTPHIELGIEDKHSPIISHRENVDDSKVKRLFGRFSWGPWSARVACDMQDVIWVPIVAVALNYAKDLVPGLNVVFGDSNNTPAPEASAGDASAS